VQFSIRTNEPFGIGYTQNLPALPISVYEILRNIRT